MLNETPIQLAHIISVVSCHVGGLLISEEHNMVISLLSMDFSVRLFCAFVLYESGANGKEIQSANLLNK